ncbi:N-acetylmuramoyl-L-alanine amidase [Anaerovibrio sp. JC8]|uniref:N-acetylmuramoyl-L-alanine amidase family protein n=1 Tax=Anaerovibrio sp. JC8 TaxID=1240085 RepID=UPI000A0C4DFB|nr:N-acetylmuramoyl-L-alanine amidase [Anaerovibrio sp. JC8]ORT99028.1 N-acetylmuramoyl-L-alanine amidase [Anaerovibrio sp. JC8]
MKVFINPGHAPNGVPDPGACNSATGLRECDVALNVGKLVEHYLNAVGIETVLLQSDDLYEVCSEANNLDADLFISIHCNSVESPYAEGTETWYCYGSWYGKQLADCIQSQIVDHLGTVNRGVKMATPHKNGLYVLTNTDMPAILVELAFISNEDDEKLLRFNQDEFARAIARGVTDYM